MSSFSDMLLPWREPCATQVTQATYERFGPALARFGEKGRQHCRLDVLRHLDYLSMAMDVNEAAPFLQYILWLKEVLAGRGIAPVHLDFSLDLINQTLTDKLPQSSSVRMATILGAARAALQDSSARAHYGLMRLAPLAQAPDYQLAILQGNRQRALASVTAAMQDGATLAQACVQIIQPALYEVGNLWQQNRITVSQEHLASAVSQNVLVGAYLQASFMPPNGKTAVFACVEGNQHALGLRMLSDSFETHGWESAYLGADVPTRDLLGDIDTRRPDLLALSMSLPQHLATARQAIETLRSELGNACPAIWVGGLATLSADAIWRYTQADGWSSDALHALEQVDLNHQAFMTPGAPHAASVNSGAP